MKLAVLFGGCSPEYSVSLQSAAAVLQNMDSSKYEAVMVGILYFSNAHISSIPCNPALAAFLFLSKA